MSLIHQSTKGRMSLLLRRQVITQSSVPKDFFRVGKNIFPDDQQDETAEWLSQELCKLIYGQKGFQTDSVKWDHFMAHFLVSDSARVCTTPGTVWRLASSAWSFSRGATNSVQREEKSSLCLAGFGINVLHFVWAAKGGGTSAVLANLLDVFSKAEVERKCFCARYAFSTAVLLLSNTCFLQRALTETLT